MRRRNLPTPPQPKKGADSAPLSAEPDADRAAALSAVYAAILEWEPAEQSSIHSQGQGEQS